MSSARRWRSATAPANGKCPQDLMRDAPLHCRRFRACLASLPTDRAADLWRTVSAEVEALRRAERPA